MVEWSIAAVLKTVDGKLSGGSNPSLCAKNVKTRLCVFAFFCIENREGFEGRSRFARAKRVAWRNPNNGKPDGKGRR